LSKILITGGAGFIGERIASALVAEGDEVHIVDNLSRGHDDEALKALAASGNAKFIHTDLLAPGAFDTFGDEYDVIVHLAAILGVQNVLDRPYATLRDNVLMHEAAIRFAGQQKGLRRFLFTSTSEVYAGGLRLDMPVPTPEDFPLALPAHGRAPDVLHAVEDLRRGYADPFGPAVYHRAAAQCLWPPYGYVSYLPQLLEESA